MGMLRAGGKPRTIIYRSDITHVANICFNLTLHDDLDGVLKNLRYKVDVRNNCSGTALIGVSDGAETLNFCTDEFKNYRFCPCHEHSEGCPDSRPDNPNSECGPTMCSLSPLVTLTSPPAPRTPLLRQTDSHAYLLATRFVTQLLKVSQEVLPTSSLRYPCRNLFTYSRIATPKRSSRVFSNGFSSAVLLFMVLSRSQQL